jgi:hypothetical protein
MVIALLRGSEQFDHGTEMKLVATEYTIYDKVWKLSSNKLETKALKLIGD